MVKLNPFKLLLLTAAISSSLTFIAKPEKSHAVILAICQNKEDIQSEWYGIRDLFCRKRRDGSTQGEFCLISPNPASFEIWNDRPRFVWEGTVKRIEIRPPASESALWSYDVESEESILYDGEGEAALQPGQEYDYWVEYETVGNDGQTITATKTQYFKIMDSQKRERIQNELREQGLENRDDRTAEDFALQRARFFTEQKLFLDVLWELFSVSNPSPEWKDTIEELRTEFCQ